MKLYEQFNESQWKLLEERARRVEKAVEQQETRERMDVLLLQISGEKYALPVEKVLSVQDGIAVKPLAGTPAHIAGIANVRGHVTSVLNLAAILGISRDEQQNATLVLIDETAAHLAFAVEEASDVQEISLETLAKLPQESPYLSGILPGGSVLLNLQAILNDSNLIVNHE